MARAVTEAGLTEFYERLTAAKSRRPSVDNVFLRGWNAGLDKAIREARLVFDDPELMPEDRPSGTQTSDSPA